MTTDEQISLSTLGGGYAEARFLEELERVLANIDDPNTDAKKLRKINVEVKFVPFEDREAASMEINVTSTLAGAKAKTGTAFIGKDRAGWKAFEHNPKQLRFPGGSNAEGDLDNDSQH